jgi:hypothetical protein
MRHVPLVAVDAKPTMRIENGWVYGPVAVLIVLACVANVSALVPEATLVLVVPWTTWTCQFAGPVDDRRESKSRAVNVTDVLAAGVIVNVYQSVPGVLPIDQVLELMASPVVGLPCG